MPLARIGAQPIVPPSTVGWYGAWCAFEGLNPYHPERMTDEQRARYEADAGEPAPPRNPYRVDPCHPVQLGATHDDEEPWRAMPGDTLTAQCLAWLRAEFGGSR